MTIDDRLHERGAAAKAATAGRAPSLLLAVACGVAAANIYYL